MHLSRFRLSRVFGILPLVCFCAVAQATLIEFTATLSGSAESPPNASPGTGYTKVTYDDIAHSLRVEATFSGLTGTTTAAHIHAATALPGVGTASVATQTPSFIGFPLGVMAGSFDNTYDLTLAASFRAGYITANGGTAASAEVALVTAMLDGKSYFNIHTSTFGGGEIRGFLTKIPDDGSTTSLLALSLVALIGIARSHRSKTARG